MQDDPEVQLKDLCNMGLLEVVNEGVQLQLVRGRLGRLLCKESVGDLGGNPLEAPVDVSVHQLNLLGGVGGGLQFGTELLAEHRLEELHPRGNPGRVSEEVGADNELKSMRRLQVHC